MDINDKLSKLTPEQAKQLGSQLNSVYIEAEKVKRQKEVAASSKRIPSAAKNNQQ